MVFGEMSVQGICPHFFHAHHIWRSTTLQVSALTSNQKPWLLTGFAMNQLCESIWGQFGLFAPSSTECGSYLGHSFTHFLFCGRKTKQGNKGAAISYRRTDPQGDLKKYTPTHQTGSLLHQFLYQHRKSQ